MQGLNHACRLTISDRAKSSVMVLIKKVGLTLLATAL